ncbi:ATP-dependent Clp protease proteolytic subunit [Candidatus Vidania fulgoroideorum]
MNLINKLLRSRILFLSGEINDELANIIILQMLYLERIERKDISLYINSPGGSISAGMAIYDTMNYIRSDVHTFCVGMAASMGAFLLSSGQAGRRYSLKNSRIMIHQPYGSFKGQATDIKIQSREIQKIKEKINIILAKNTGKSKRVIRRDTERDTFFSPKEAKKYGIIDKIL